jgi:hypothetical protein
MPRFGKKYKMYDLIQPDLKLDITHILDNGMIIWNYSDNDYIYLRTFQDNNYNNNNNY